MPSRRQWELQDPRCHEMATERQASQAAAAGMLQRRVKHPKTAAGRASSLPAASVSRRGLQKPLGRVMPGSVALTQAGRLTGGDLANGVFGSVLGHPLAFGRAVVTGELPCGESTTMPSRHGRWETLKIPQEGDLVGDILFVVLRHLLKNEVPWGALGWPST